MNVFQFVADGMRPVTGEEFAVQALLYVAGDLSSNYSSYSAGQDKRKFVKDFFRARLGAESPVYQRLAVMLN